ncbi:MAG TPA: response regulator transcription factor [Pyrinomonadaceae bacterium]|nr:response regulator transcription factor [Pyrinomonadaceae bacterium]
MDLNVVILEDDPRYRHSLEMLFGNTPGFRLGASFGSAHAMLEELETRERAGRDPSWQLALVDIELPGMNGIEATRRLKKHLSALTVVMLTVFEDPTIILEAITAGADGYLLKKTSAPELLSQLKAIASGGSPLTPDVARTVLSLLRERTPKRISGQFFRNASPTKLQLTEREHAVLQALVKGLSYKQVGLQLNISIDTVRTHIRAVYRKLQVHSVAEAVARAIREKLV